MSKVWLVARKDMREALRSRSTYLYIIILSALAGPYFGGFGSIAAGLLRQGASQQQLLAASQSFLNTTGYTLPLIMTMLICGVLSAYAVIMDKAKRTLESLMATPLSLTQIWIGKSLAVTLPSVLAALVVSALAIIGLNVLLVVPTTGRFLLPDALSLVTGLVLVPSLVFVTVSLVCFLQLILSNPRLPNFVFTGVFLAVYTGTITELTGGWNFALIYLLVTLLVAVANLLIARFLIRERVVLSSKG